MMDISTQLCGSDMGMPKNGYNLNGKSTECTPQEHTCDLTSKESNLTPIQNFYNEQSIFITGVTGSLGKLLIEKLLRGCPETLLIYMLVRPKKGKNVQQRVDELFDSVLFSQLKEKKPKFRHQIVTIVGDCRLPGLGISATDRALITREVSIVFHLAATIRFNEKMNSAVSLNVRSVQDVIDMCKEMPRLKSFVQVSTAYCNCPHTYIEEKIYDPPMETKKLIALMECLDQKLIEEITPRLLGAWPNTYTFTKAVAESIVKEEANDLPVGIFRPGIVLATFREPLEGWTDYLYGPAGSTAATMFGIIHSCLSDSSIKLSVVPGDLMTNALIASAWDIANHHRARLNKEKTTNSIPVYNYVSNDNPVTSKQIQTIYDKYISEISTVKAVWYPRFVQMKNRIIHLIYISFVHLLPALLVDSVTFLTGKRPRMLKMYKKIHALLDALSYFTLKEWSFETNTVKALISKMTPEDRNNFACDITKLEWNRYFQLYLIGIRIYLLNDPLETIPRGRVRYQRLYWLHQTVKLILAYVFFRICWFIVSQFT